jgi:hypothetical protein
MSMTIAPPQASIDVQPVVGLFDDIGRAEHALHQLFAAGFEPGDAHMEWEEIDAPVTGPPAPHSYAAPFAFVASLLGGAIPAVLAAYFAPQKVTLYGLGVSISPVLALALGGGTFGWILGAILGFGRLGREDGLEPISLQAPIITVSVHAPSRPSEARAILHAAGAREIHGGDRAHTALSGRTSPRSHSAAVPVARATANATRRAIPPTPAGRHERLPLGPQGMPTHPRRTGLGLVAAIVIGGIIALLSRRRK